MRVGAVQLNSTEDTARNLETADRLVRDAAAKGAEVVVLPEKWSVLGTDEHMTAGHLGGDVPVPAHPAVLGSGQVPDHGAQPRQVERAVVQRQYGPLQFQRDVPLGGQVGFERLHARQRMSTGKNFQAFLERRQARWKKGPKEATPLWRRLGEVPVPLRLMAEEYLKYLAARFGLTAVLRLRDAPPSHLGRTG